jgi:Cys-tRNA(Pro)/Cys-tRNA(Cys) deacylase
MEAAEALGLDPARVLKTLVADLDGTLTVCIGPGRVRARPAWSS